ncbi:hypothetical protein [Streptomyces marincola]|uniref:hypothetical protein n=1 Tax=Streptomyces marincola TaxID=2878388 RepID=UPI001CF4BB16|nr:hypothetical protein [Streptomyces marincola]UCM89494.1 hypothetical protein LC193_16920 [Streptomyces marincola]
MALADERVGNEAGTGTGEPGAGEPAAGAEPKSGQEPVARQEPALTGPPTRYRMITPTDWFRIPLRSETKRARAVQILVDMAYPNKDEFATKRHELRELLGNVTDSAAQRDAIEIYLSTQAALGVPIPASLMVTAEPEHPTATQQLPPATLADGIRDKYHGQAEVSVVRLPSGEAVRCRRTELSEDSKELGQPEERPNTLLEFYLPVPYSTAWLVLTFSAPLRELADAQVEMFDAIAGSFRWSE